MEQALAALQALLSGQDPVATKQANDWLTQFQQDPAAWQVADQLLSRPAQSDADVPVYFFAAQTMRTKVQFDFNELPNDAYASLRDSLINHIDRFRAPNLLAVHTQLAIAIADLAIQMDVAWPQPVGSLFERWGSNQEAWATLLEVMRMLPEENMNYKLMADSHKRVSNREVLQQAMPQVIQFLLTLQCPSVQAKKKVLECFLSWIKFTNIPAQEIAQNQMVPECFQYLIQGGELSETATDIIIEVLRMCSQDLGHFQPVIQVILAQLPTLRQKFEALLAPGVEVACDNERDALQQICRIFVETGECLIPLIMEQVANPEVLSILQVICRCTALPVPEISSIPLEFWHRLGSEVCRHPETDARIDQFQGIYVEVLKVMIQNVTLPETEDPFQADDDYTAYRQRFLGLAEDCLEILTPNSALEHVLKSLQEGQRRGVNQQEAHFFCLQTVGARAEVREGSVLWDLIQSLPPLIGQTIEADTTEAAILHFTKKTAIELLGCLWKWVKTRPEFLRSALEMISTLLMASAPANAPPHVLERTKQVQQAAAMAFKDICFGGKPYLQDLVPQLCTLYTSTMALPIRMHLFIVEGVGAVVAHLRQDEAFKSGLEALITPLVQGMQTELEKPQVISEILDRLTTIVRQLRVQDGSSKAAAVGTLIDNALWPLVRQSLTTHPGDPKVVEKGCRLLKHSMRCVPDLFKPNVGNVAEMLVTAFMQHQHSSYCYSAEILANTYAQDPEIVPILTQLFNRLSETGINVLTAAHDRLDEITELVEDFYGMFERYLRYAPMIVLEAPTLFRALQLLNAVIFVQQKDAIEAIIAFIEAVLMYIADARRGTNDEQRRRMGQILQTHVVQVVPGLVEALFRLIAGVPTRYVQETIPCVLEGIRDAFPQEYPGWLEASFNAHLPASVASLAERKNFGEQLVAGDTNRIYDTVQDLCYRCEQVVLRSRAPATGKTTGGK